MRGRTGDGIDMQTLKILFAVMILNGCLIAQEVHKIPFASSNNAIELAIVNASEQVVSGIKVKADFFPSWILIGEKKKTISFLKPNLEQKAIFTFAVEKSAPVGKEQTLTFTVSAPNGESWTKQIKIIIAPPLNFKLYQNYPNPFNPSTVIGYQLPKDAHINLKIYNLLGQEVITLIDEDVQAGYHETNWDASNAASGVYFMQLFQRDASGNYSSERKQMMVLK
jgi:hypothetical protein